MAIDRLQFLLHGLQKDHFKGIEIGAYYNPLAPKAKNWHTLVIDYAAKPVLIENFHRKIDESGRNDIADMVSNIEDVDIVWAGGSLEELFRNQSINGQMDYFLSSHNIEHSIDVIDYLRGASACLKPDGWIAMAIPDLRFTFDFFRNPTTFGDALLARQLGNRLHPPAMLLDNDLNYLLSDGQSCWITSQPLGRLSFHDDPNTVYHNYSLAIGSSTADYKDCHRWVFTPASFELLLFDLHWTGLCNLKIDSLVAAEQGVLGSEFLVRLSNTPAHAFSGDEIKARRLALQLKNQAQLAGRVQHPLFRSVSEPPAVPTPPHRPAQPGF